jgi:nicotinate-nucleotide pyrophosphorylase (carboxylating)
MDLCKELESLIDLALAEDIRSGDFTTEALIPEDVIVNARLFLKQAGVVAGLPLITALFKKIDPKVIVEWLIPEGSYQKAGTIIVKISGPARIILTVERTLLNLLQHASGVATVTAAYVRKIAGQSCAIMDTRRTLPGLRALEKYAVKIAGGTNHRFGLDDRLVIKSNHLAFLKGLTAHPIIDAANKVKAYKPDLPVEIQVDDEQWLPEILQTHAVAVMLSNMLPNEVARCVKKMKGSGKKVYIESAGAITLDTVRAFAETGVDGISIGALTHSVQALDMSLRLT